MKTISKRRLIDRIVQEAIWEPILKSIKSSYDKPGKMIERLSTEEREVLKTCTSKDFKNGRIYLSDNDLSFAYIEDYWERFIFKSFVERKYSTNSLSLINDLKDYCKFKFYVYNPFSAAERMEWILKGF